jgi:hypothetical protein
MGRPRRLTDAERKASGALRQRRYKERHGWIAKVRQRESMRALRARRKEALSVTTAAKTPVNNRKPLRDDALLPLGELRYVSLEEVEADPKVMAEQEQRRDEVRRRMGPKAEGGPRVPEKIREAPETENERDTYAQLEEFKARRAAMEKGVQVELIL